MKQTFTYKGCIVEINKQPNAASALAYRNGELFCVAFVHLDKVTIEDKIKQKIDSKL